MRACHLRAPPHSTNHFQAPAASASDSEPATGTTTSSSKSRIDGTGLKREGFFGGQERKSWLSESDIDFFAGGARFASTFTRLRAGVVFGSVACTASHAPIEAHWLQRCSMP